MVVMALMHEGQSAEFSFVLEWCNLVFIIIFVLEAVLKIGGVGWRVYFSRNWNKFDFFLVVISIVDLVINLALYGNVIDNDVSSWNSDSTAAAKGFKERNSNILFVSRLLRIFRVSRLFRLLEAGGMRVLMCALVSSLPAIINVVLLAMIFLFIFSVLVSGII